MKFNQALKIVLSHEGGYVNHPKDPGGETNYGITARVARENGYDGDMRSIPMSIVESIYKRQYWDRISADKLPEHLRLHVFDAAVNSGVDRAAKWLQELAGVLRDGSIGPKTIAASGSVSALDYTMRRLRFLRGLDNWRTFGRGWQRRLESNIGHKLD